jgi:hypothetical protein
MSWRMSALRNGHSKIGLAKFRLSEQGQHTRTSLTLKGGPTVEATAIPGATARRPMALPTTPRARRATNLRSRGDGHGAKRSYPILGPRDCAILQLASSRGRKAIGGSRSSSNQDATLRPRVPMSSKVRMPCARWLDHRLVFAASSAAHVATFATSAHTDVLRSC